MNKQLATCLIGLATVAMTCGTSLKAADSSSHTAMVPFDFQVQNQTMKAGKYTTYKVSNAVAMRDNRTLSSIFVTGHSGLSGNSGSKLVFHKYGDRYFLAEIWFGDESSGHNVTESRREKELRASLNEAKPQIVYLALR